MGIVCNCTDKYQKCIDACNKCFQACHECVKLCLNEPDVKARIQHISMMHECASICKLSACFMIMDAKHVKEVCDICATICDECANGCSRFKDDHCQKCADVCKNCADECRAM